MRGLARRVRDERKRRAWTQQELANEADIGLGMLNNFERERTTPHATNLRKILNALNMENGEGDTEAEATRDGWPADVQTFNDIMSIYLMSRPEPERSLEIRDITRQIVSRAKGRS